MEFTVLAGAGRDAGPQCRHGGGTGSFIRWRYRLASHDGAVSLGIQNWRGFRADTRAALCPGRHRPSAEAGGMEKLSTDWRIIP
ncbi:MAG: hypothetical protein CME04_06430 [Gemmatimonadaceae bacterium]|nr:hypothetical protein [Gemmatimonadaceae bacterium]